MLNTNVKTRIVFAYSLHSATTFYNMTKAPYLHHVIQTKAFLYS